MMGGYTGNGTAQTLGANGTAVQTVNVASCGSTSGLDSSATGLCAHATQNGATAYGSNAQAISSNTTAIGFRAVASQSGAVAIGYNAQATGDPTVALGSNALASGNNSVALGAGAQVIGNNSVALGAGSVAKVDNTVSVGAPGSERQITNVAPGVNPTDAVNVAQLSQVATQINQFGAQLNQVASVAYSGIAMAGALAALPQVDPGKTFSISAGVGNYGGYSALSIGASARLYESVVVRFGVSTTTGGSRLLINAGIGYSW